MRTFRKFFIVAGRMEVCLRLLPVQFETEGNGQNEIVSYMDRSEVKI